MFTVVDSKIDDDDSDLVPQQSTNQIIDSDEEGNNPPTLQSEIASRARLPSPIRPSPRHSSAATNNDALALHSTSRSSHLGSGPNDRASAHQLVDSPSSDLMTGAVLETNTEEGPSSVAPGASVVGNGDDLSAIIEALFDEINTFVPEDEPMSDNSMPNEVMPNGHSRDAVDEPFAKPDVTEPGTPRDVSNFTPLDQQVIDTIEEGFLDLTMGRQLQQSPQPLQPEWIGQDFTTILRNHLREMRDDHESMTKIWLGKASAHTRPEFPQSRTGFMETTDPFAEMKPIQEGVSIVTNDPSVRRFEGETFTASGKTNKKYTITAPVTTWEDDTPEVPEYMQYTNINRNVLGTNTRQLRVWPYCGDEVSDKFYQNIKPEFDAVVDQLPRKILYSQQASSHSDYFEAFLEEIGSSMDHILSYLLDRDEDGIQLKLIKLAEEFQVPKLQVRSKVNQILTSRGKICKEDFDRDSERWIRVYSALPPLDDQAYWIAAYACHAFWQETKFSAWQIARKFAHVVDSDEETDNKDTTYSDIACRVCHIHDCPYHGENRERRDSDYDMAHFTEVDKLDVDYPPEINFKYRITAPQPLEGDNSVKSSVKEKSLSWWKKETRTWAHNERGPFFACDHPGKSCNQAECDCYTEKVCCEKICGCSKDCGRRFRGCSCKQGKRNKMCAQDGSCECFVMNRECDPDLCGGCGVHVVLDPTNRDDILEEHCQNAPIQFGLPKRTLLGNSRVHGFGLYAGEPISKDEFVGEYAGEIIAKEETERRGVIYREQNRSYLFNLNRDQEVDSQRLGNKTRFINHAAMTSNLRNVAPRIVLCNMVQRIGMFAIKDIVVGEELFFDYGKDYHETLIDGSKKVKNKGGKVISKTHNYSLINGFIEPESTIGPNDEAEEADDSDDDRPLKRVRAKRTLSEHRSKSTSKLKAAKKSQDSSTSTNAGPSEPGIRNTRTGIKSTLPKDPTRPRIEDIPMSEPPSPVTRENRLDATAGTQEALEDGESDFEMRDAEEEEEEDGNEEDESSEDEDLRPRRSGRARRKSWKVRRDES